MTKVRIVQVLCPARHCIVATAYESPDGEMIPGVTATLREKVQKLITDNQMNPWCGICKSRRWNYEDRATAFSTMEEALPHIMEVERLNMITRDFFRRTQG